MNTKENFRNEIINAIKNVINTDQFSNHFKDFIEAVFVDHGDKFIVFTHSKATKNTAGDFQYPNKIYIDIDYVKRLSKKHDLKLVLFFLLRHELRHFIQCVVMIELCNNVKEAEKCWHWYSTKLRDKDPLELDANQMEHGEYKSIEEFYDFIRGLIEDYRKSL